MVATDGARLGTYQERVLIVGGLLVFAAAGYYWTGLREVDPQTMWTPRTRLDDYVPFMPVMMYCYAWVYSAMFYPAFVVRSRALFRRVGLAYLAVVSINLVCFVLFPATASGIRPGPEVLDQLDLSWFHNWGLRFNYALDPPRNLFPSLHMSSATLAALCAWRARPLYGYLAAAMVVAIGFAICAVRQHFAIDGVAGVVLGTAAYLALVHRWGCEDGEPDGGLTWRGPTAYLAFHTSIYGGLYLIYLAGWRPWES